MMNGFNNQVNNMQSVINNGNWNNTQNTYYNPTVEAENQKSAIRIDEASRKAWIDIQKQEYLDESRANRRECMREYRENLYDEISIENGVITLSTRNSAFNKNRRMVCNFVSPSLTRLVSSEGDEGIIILRFRLSNTEKNGLAKRSEFSKRQVCSWQNQNCRWRNIRKNRCQSRSDAHELNFKINADM